TGRLGEEQYLRDRCLYSMVPVILDGKPISAGFAAASRGLAQIPIRDTDLRGVMSVVERDSHCELRLIKDGVWIDTRELPQAGTNILAVVEGDALRKDVSQAKIVANAALERIKTTILRARWTLWKAAVGQHAGRPLETI